MPKICQNCNKEFPINIKINGKIRNLNNRKYCLKCTPFGCHNTTALVPGETYLHQSEPIEFVCGCCKKLLPKNEFFQKSNSEKRKRKVSCYCKKCNNNITYEKQKKLKKQCADYKGGKCCICGYNKSYSALQFHHLDPLTKKFSISSACNRKFENLIPELDKCILLCSNCHAEIHDGTISYEKEKMVGATGFEPVTGSL